VWQGEWVITRPMPIWINAPAARRKASQDKAAPPRGPMPAASQALVVSNGTAMTSWSCLPHRDAKVSNQDEEIVCHMGNKPLKISDGEIRGG
jgi:hypothetical protein